MDMAAEIDENSEIGRLMFLDREVGVPIAEKDDYSDCRIVIFPVSGEPLQLLKCWKQ